MIHHEGYRILIGTLLVLAVLNIVLFRYVSVDWVNYLVLFGSIVLFGLFLQFFRNPSRTIEQHENHIIAPADGKIVVIEEVEEPEYFKDKRRQISIFMSPFNVHVNRNPIGGTFSYFKYHPGEYLVAWHPKSSTLNERTTAVIKHSSGKEILFRQIAGAVARRIRYYVQAGDSADQGLEMGFIKFGSRVDVFVPMDAKIQVEMNQKSVGGKTILATFE
jgi:phosphatidylserine decarboxylase